MPPDIRRPISAQPVQRPSLAAAPLQRSNYGIPPRQSVAPTPGPRHMDIAPMPSRPAPTPVPAPAPLAIPEAPATYSSVRQPEAPLFTATKPTAAPSTKKSYRPAVVRAVRWACLTVGTVALLGGAGRLATAGSISGYTVAVGAVTANDGHSMNVQYTANDGELHHFTISHSVASMVPGTSLQVAYRPGAPDATVRQVSVVQSHHNLGMQLVATGVVLLIIGGFLSLRRRAKPSVVPVPVTV